ncbi:MAG: hypothetical protein FJ225_08565 [Lentisphaerae bacterium]|nr:hypothetical protein [Lentisphaerota bacterium]
MNRRDFMRMTGLGILAAGMPGVGMAEGASPSSGKPNIIFVLGDDMGINIGIGCYSDRKGLTPNLDALAAGGVRFERCFATPICGPTRCLLMTGRYPFRTGGWDHSSGAVPAVLAQNEYPMARILSEAGYDTCCVGKWRQMAQTPREWGFDEYVMSPTATGYYWTKKYTKNGKEITEDKDVFFPDVCQDYALEFIRRHGVGGKAAGKPFFLYYPTHLMHNHLAPTPDSKTGVKSNPGERRAENLIYLDKQIGALATELDRLNLRENTLIIFAGDNGTDMAGYTINKRRISGGKHTMLEGGALVPCIVNWKGTAPAGSVVKDLVDFSDLLPTFAELAGAKLPDKVPYDGLSFAPLLRGKKGVSREWIFMGCDDKWYVREDKWKLNQAGELFDMKDAPFTEPLVPADSKDPEAAAARKRLQAVLDKLNPAGGKLPPKNSDKDNEKE